MNYTHEKEMWLEDTEFIAQTLLHLSTEAFKQILTTNIRVYLCIHEF